MNIYLATKENQETIINNQGTSKLTLDEVNAKVDNLEILVKALSENGSSVIKSIQRGTITWAKSKISEMVSISSVDVDKCIVLLDGSITGSYSNLSTSSPILNSLTSKYLTIVINNASNTGTDKTSWQIIEFY